LPVRRLSREGISRRFPGVTLGGSILLALCAGATAAPPLPPNAAIDAEAARMLAGEKVVGMPLAVIDEGKIVHFAAYGQRNAERNLPLDTDTIMVGASLTKVALAPW
jgi:CubicO group peptidase (beta-lactamase class C family)